MRSRLAMTYSYSPSSMRRRHSRQLLGATKPPSGSWRPTNSTWFERSVPNSGYWRVLVVAIRSPETDLAATEDGVQTGGGEGRVRVAVLQVVALDRVTDRDRENHCGQADAWANPRPARRTAERSRSEPRIRPNLDRTRGARRSGATAPAGAGPCRGSGPGRDSGDRIRSRGACRRGPRRRSGRRARRAQPPGRRRRRPAQAGSSAARGQSRSPARASRAEQWPEHREAVVEARQEPVRPDRAVGQIAEDAVPFAAAERLVGRRAE